MPRAALTGTRIRERRAVLGIKQAELARTVEISASYLNLIEHNRRRIGGKILVDLARALSVDVSALTEGAEADLIDQLGEAASAQSEIDAEVERIDEFVSRFPGWAALLGAQQRRLVALERRVATLAERLEHDPFLSAALHDVLTKVTAIRSTASILVETPDLDADWLQRFHGNLQADSLKLAESTEALVGYLDDVDDAESGLVTPQAELEAFLDESDFHLPALETGAPVSLDTMLAEAPALRSPAAVVLAREYLAQYQQDAARMPLAPFAAAAQAEHYDPGRLAALFAADLPAVFRRLAALPPDPGTARIGLVVADGSGTLRLRKRTDQFPLPRFGAGCPLWPLYLAMSRPMTAVVARLRHAGSPGRVFLSYAIAQPGYPSGFGGPQVFESYMLLLPEPLAGGTGADLPEHRIGTNCRICPLAGCAARREPSVLAETADARL